MKTQFFNLVLILSFIVEAPAQNTSIASLEDCSICDETGVYYKDLNNFLNTFEGTYVYNQNGVYFKMILQKKTLSNVNNFYYEDLLIGAYQYTNNSQSINYLNTLNTFHANGWDYIIDGNTILTGNGYLCLSCGTYEKWIHMSISDPESGSISNFILRKTTLSGQEAIIVRIQGRIKDNMINMDNPPTYEIEQPANYPLGQELILIKQ